MNAIGRSGKTYYLPDLQALLESNKDQRGHYRYVNQPVKLLCAKDVADSLGITNRVAARLLRTNQIRGFKLSGKYWRTTELHLEVFISQSFNQRAAEFSSSFSS